MPTTGEILAEAGTRLNRELADKIQNAAVPFVWIETEERKVKVLSNMMVDLADYVDCGSGGSGCYRISILSGSEKDTGRK